MNGWSRGKRIVLMVVVLVSGLACLGFAQDNKKMDSCTLLTKSEIQAALGQPVGDGALNTKANPLVGQPCEYKVGDYGAFSILVKTTGAGETADRVMAELKKQKIAVSEAAAIGESSFFSSPGYGMFQLNTFKGSRYLIITMMVPGAKDAVQKSAAEDLMRKALKKI